MDDFGQKWLFWLARESLHTAEAHRVDMQLVGPAKRGLLLSSVLEHHHYSQWLGECADFGLVPDDHHSPQWHKIAIMEPLRNSCCYSKILKLACPKRYRKRLGGWLSIIHVIVSIAICSLRMRVLWKPTAKIEETWPHKKSPSTLSQGAFIL
ncbi:MAG: hypothetical protein ACI9XB_005230 [Gammaproteobacteria bacterium]|jgi:hypothetical protein